ncbi:acyltransferase [Desulfococcus sp.]|uniref:acyltransferase n=1 Tax=Desulfococcus sp. TaxID=2025834 RepID=UPI003593AB14
MTNDAVSNLRGAVSLFFYAVNTLFWVIPIFLLAVLKPALPQSAFRKFCDRILTRCAENWIGCNNLNQDAFTDTTVRVFGMEKLDRRSWYLVVSNHQTWVDILVLQRIFHRRIPFLKFFLKKELFWFPVLGQAWWALDFPFMKRYTRRFLEKNPHLRGQDLEVTRKACEKFKTIPVSVMNFVEGTRFTPKKHDRQGSPYRNLLKPRAGGIAFVIGAMGEYLDSMIDVTIAYPGGPQSFWDFLCGRIREIRVQVRALPISPAMLGDYFNDDAFRDAFQNWVNALWEQKDQCVEALLSGAPGPGAETACPGLPSFCEPSES